MPGPTEGGEQAPNSDGEMVARDDPDEIQVKTLDEPMETTASREAEGSLSLSDPRILKEALDKANEEYLYRSTKAVEQKAVKQLLVTPEPEEDPNTQVIASGIEHMGHAPGVDGTPELGNQPSTSSTTSTKNSASAKREQIADKVKRTSQHLRDTIVESDKAQKEVQALPPETSNTDRTVAEAKAAAALTFRIKVEDNLVDTHTEETTEYLYQGCFDDAEVPVKFDDLSQASLNKMSVPSECYSARSDIGDGLQTSLVEITPDSGPPDTEYGVNLPSDLLGDFIGVSSQEQPLISFSPRRESDPLLSAGGIRESSDEDANLGEQSSPSIDKD